MKVYKVNASHQDGPGIQSWLVLWSLLFVPVTVWVPTVQTHVSKVNWVF